MSLFSRKTPQQLALQAAFAALLLAGQLQAIYPARPIDPISPAKQKELPKAKKKLSHKPVKEAKQRNSPVAATPKNDFPHADKHCTGCSDVTVICDLPITITKSGRYCLAGKSNTFYATDTGAAITVEADNVDIDLAGHTINLVGNGTTAGISATGVDNLSIHDGTIVGLNQNFGANNLVATEIQLTAVTNATCKNLKIVTQSSGASIGFNCINVLFSNCTFDSLTNATGISINGQFEDVTIENCAFRATSQFSNDESISVTAPGSNLTVQSCTFDNAATHIDVTVFFGVLTNLEISDCAFTNTVQAMNMFGPSSSQPLSNCLVRNCSISVSGSVVPQPEQPPTAGIAFTQCNGMLVENCDFQFTAMEASTNAGSFISFFSSLGAIVRDCSMSNTQTLFPSALEPVVINSSQNVLIEHCVIDGNANLLTDNANVHIQTTPPFPCSDIKVKNSIIRNNAFFGIFCDGVTNGPMAPTNIQIDNCLIDGALAAGLFFDNAAICTVKNCEISGTTGGPGISLA
ncbi:MAG: right-handed parallel beta-helix repeat-containing protein, partial [Verrucomicrobia bacterium]|nr:right-handed parallel beta-helix repeat-containing protein [Verrucomicrobiota bacterium]